MDAVLEWTDNGARAALHPPVSKSDAQRALVLADILGRPELAARISGDLPNDVAVLIRGLRAFGSTIDCEDAGTPFRLLLGQAAILPVTTTFTGTQRLGERPHGDLIAALRSTLPDLTVVDGWPLVVHGTDRPAKIPEFHVQAHTSSQFPSSLLLAAARLVLRERRAWTVRIDGPLASPGYLTLTVDWLRRVGFDVDDGLTVRGHHPPDTLPTVPGDGSSIAYLLLLAWRSGGRVTGVDGTADHPDHAIVDVLAQAGLTVDDGRVSGVARSGVDVDGSAPDLLPTVAALACVLPGPSVLRHTAILRGKESDRLAAIVRLARAAGAAVDGDDRLLRIVPGPIPAEIHLQTGGDHRIAMCAGVLAALTGARVHIDHPECVAKSFPGFWAEAERAGLSYRAQVV